MNSIHVYSKYAVFIEYSILTSSHRKGVEGGGGKALNQREGERSNTS
jgi:hypothetical protein